MIKLSELRELRNQLHKEIVQHTVKAGGSDMYELELQQTVDAAYSVLDQSGIRVLVEVEVQAIDGVTGDLIAIAADGLQKKLRYIDLSMEQLLQIYEQLKNNQYKILELC